MGGGRGAFWGEGRLDAANFGGWRHGRRARMRWERDFGGRMPYGITAVRKAPILDAGMSVEWTGMGGFAFRLRCE